MKRGGVEVLRKVLKILPVVQGQQGIRVRELSRITGIPEEEIVEELPRLVNLCGVPPYSPMDLVDLEVEGDRVSLRFADEFRRPVRLTLREALALDMALSGWAREEEGPFARTVESIRAKVRGALSPDVAAEVDQARERITAPDEVGLAGEMVRLLKLALSLQVEVRMEYFSHRDGRLAWRTVRPYGIFEQHGRWYLVGWCPEREHVLTFRADRIRAAELAEDEYDIPDEFEVGAHRTGGPPRPETGGMQAELAFDADIARFAREDFPGEEIREQPDGSIHASIACSGSFWLVSRLLRWGASARIEEPEQLASELVQRAREALSRYEGDEA